MLLTNSDRAAARIKQALDNGEIILIYGDTDLDGLTTVLGYRTFFEILEHTNIVFSKYEEKTHSIPASVLRDVIRHNPQLVLISDCGSSSFEQLNTLAQGRDIIVADHHPIEEGQVELVDNVILVNPTGLDGNTNLSGGCVVYEILRQYLKTYEPAQLEVVSGLLNHIALISLYGDSIADNNQYTRELHARASKSMPTQWFKYLENKGKPLPISSRNINFTIAPAVNALFRNEKFHLLNSFFLSDDILMDLNFRARLIEEMGEVRQHSRRAIDITMEQLIPRIVEKEYKNLIVVDLSTFAVDGVSSATLVNNVGLIAGKLSDMYNKTAFVIGFKEPQFKYSVRSKRKEALSIFKKLLPASGHDQAFGGHLSQDEYSTLQRALKRIDNRFGKLEDDSDRFDANRNSVTLSEVNYKLLLDLAKENEFIKDQTYRWKVKLTEFEWNQFQIYEGQYGDYKRFKFGEKTVFLNIPEGTDHRGDKFIYIVYKDEGEVLFSL